MQDSDSVTDISDHPLAVTRSCYYWSILAISNCDWSNKPLIISSFEPTTFLVLIGPLPSRIACFWLVLATAVVLMIGPQSAGSEHRASTPRGCKWRRVRLCNLPPRVRQSGPRKRRFLASCPKMWVLPRGVLFVGGVGSSLSTLWPSGLIFQVLLITLGIFAWGLSACLPVCVCFFAVVFLPFVCLFIHCLNLL